MRSPCATSPLRDPTKAAMSTAAALPLRPTASAHALPPPSSSAPKERQISLLGLVRRLSAAIRTWRSVLVPSSPAAGERRIVVYLTSLRVVRKTFEDCRAVTSILRGFSVAFDERDVSMDSGFLAELEGMLGCRQPSLPRVFVGGRYLGGAEEIRRLHEAGELQEHLEGVRPAEPRACGACGGVRFVLCHACNGSHRRYCDKTGFRICPSCNDNGLCRCPQCCCSANPKPLPS